MRLTFGLLFLFLSFCLPILSGHVPANTIVWLGGEGNWSDPSQWENQTLPTANDDVIIRSGLVRIQKKEIVAVNQIQLLDGAKIENNGHILIEDASYSAIIIKEFSQFKNLKKGKIEIRKAADSGIMISERGMLLNSGKIYIGAPIETVGMRGKQIGLHGMVLDGQSIFRNNKLLEIQNTKDKAIVNQGESIFTNHKKIILGGEKSLLQRNGIQNTAVITNNKKGKIYISGTYLDGIRNDDSGRFENLGKIYLGKAKVITTYGIYCNDDSSFRNEKKGKIYAYKIGKEIVHKVKNGEFMDLGKVVVKK